MASGQFYVVYIRRSAETTLAELKKKMNLSRDWYRINESLWVLFTTSGAETWFNRLRPLISDEGSLFISKLDISDRQGWMNEKFWGWLREHGAPD